MGAAESAGSPSGIRVSTPHGERWLVPLFRANHQSRATAGEAKQITNLKGCRLTSFHSVQFHKEPREGKKLACRYTARSKNQGCQQQCFMPPFRRPHLLARYAAGLGAQHRKNKVSISPSSQPPTFLEGTTMCQAWC